MSDETEQIRILKNDKQTLDRLAVGDESYPSVLHRVIEAGKHAIEIAKEKQGMSA